MHRRGPDQHLATDGSDAGSAAAPPGSPVLLIPGIDGSGPGHWQTAWERERGECRRVELGCWAEPDREQWIGRLAEAVGAERWRPLVLVAHSLGCLLVSWWAERRPDQAARVAAAMLVAPCDTERPHDARLAAFGGWPTRPLPFPALVVASDDDPYAAPERSLALAGRLGAQLATVGRAGHINAASRLGSWPQGQRLLAGLVRRAGGGVDSR